MTITRVEENVISVSVDVFVQDPPDKVAVHEMTSMSMLARWQIVVLGGGGRRCQKTVQDVLRVVAD